MDPERNEMPDIDIDICQDGRSAVLEYVRKKYGQIAQIITFGTMKARAVIRDVCRVLDVPLADADRLAKLVPAGPGMTLDKALEAEPDFRKAYEQDDKTKEVIEIGRKLEGLARHASVHACGVVIADEDLTDFVPLCTVKGSEDLVTQFEGPTAEKIGLLKMDFLGLKTLSVIERTLKLIDTLHGKEIDIEKIDITDQQVYKHIFGSGRTKGVFQFESSGMADMLIRLRPDRIEDLIAANALYRPGPMALIPDYIERKHGGKWDVPHPIMKEVLAETFGIMVYQEQVMRIGNRLGGIPLRQAYALIKAISKKKAKVIAKAKKQFIEGCLSQGLKKNQADEIFELIEKFAGYGFNKSHATRYSFIAYQTAWLKHYYPLEFMAALLTYEDNTDKIVDYIGECREMGIEVTSPNINESFDDFTVIYEERNSGGLGRIRFGLAAVKGVGQRAVEEMIRARKSLKGFKNLYDFCENVDLRLVNKQVIEALIKAGAFDNLGGSRSQMIAGLEDAMKAGARAQADAAGGQLNFFGDNGFGDSGEESALPDVAPWSEMQMLTYEKEVLGFYVTSNPLSRHAEELNAYSTAHTSELANKKHQAEVVIGGMITKIRSIVTKKGRNAGSKMAFITIEDLQGSCEVVMFPSVLKKYVEMTEVDRVVFISGKVNYTRETPSVLCDEVIGIDEAADKLSGNVRIKMFSDEIDDEKINGIRGLCEKYRGRSALNFTVTIPSGYRIQAVADSRLSVRADAEFRKKLETIVGAGKVDFVRN